MALVSETAKVIKGPPVAAFNALLGKRKKHLNGEERRRKVEQRTPAPVSAAPAAPLVGIMAGLAAKLTDHISGSGYEAKGGGSGQPSSFLSWAKIRSRGSRAIL